MKKTTILTAFTFILFVFVLIIQAFILRTPYAEATASPPYFGYFDSGHRGGNSNEEVFDHSNLIWVWVAIVGEPTDPQSFVVELETARRRNLAVIAEVGPAFWAQMLDIHPVYQSRWADTVKLIRPFVEDGTIVAFYHRDEPDGYVVNGFYDPVEAWSRLETVNFAIKREFPNTPIAVTFSGWSLRDGVAPWLTIPKGYDWVGYDCYWSWDNCYGYSVLEYIERLRRLLTDSSQKIYLVPSGIMTYADYYTPTGIKDIVDIAQRHFDLFLRNPSDFVAFMPFAWRHGDGQHLGVVHIPELQAKYREIGLQFKEGKFAPKPLTINTTVLPAGLVRTAYSAVVSASGGRGSYLWKLESGALPRGLNLVQGVCITVPCQSPVGILGIPTKSGTYDFSISVTDGKNKVSQKFKIKISRQWFLIRSLDQNTTNLTAIILDSKIIETFTCFLNPFGCR